MAMLRKFFIELIVMALIAGWAVDKFPEVLTPYMPWLCLMVVAHLAWEYGPIERLKGYFSRSRGKKLITAIVATIICVVALSFMVLRYSRIGFQKLEEAERAKEHPPQQIPPVLAPPPKKQSQEEVLSESDLARIRSVIRIGAPTSQPDPFLNVSDERLDEMARDEIRNLDDLVGQWSLANVLSDQGYHDDLWHPTHPLTVQEKVVLKKNYEKRRKQREDNYREEIKGDVNAAASLCAELYRRLPPFQQLQMKSTLDQVQKEHLAKLRAPNSVPGDLNRLQEDLTAFEKLFKLRLKA